MNGFENEIYRYLLFVSNIAGLILLYTAIKWPHIARFLFFLLFAWACWMNWTTVREKPLVYLDYAGLSWSDSYSRFIRGWFSEHLTSTVSFIAICQGMISISMLIKGWVFKTGAISAILFLLAIAPLGVGSGFPTSITMAIAMIIILRKHRGEFIWEHKKAMAL